MQRFTIAFLVGILLCSASVHAEVPAQSTTDYTLVTVAYDGSKTDGDDPSISADGSVVAFQSISAMLVAGFDPGYYTQIFVRDLRTGVTSVASRALDGAPSNSDSEHATISGDGRYVAFDSFSSNLVPGDTDNSSINDRDVFLYDRQTGQLACVSVTPAGLPANNYSHAASISADGRYVAFESASDQLVAGDTNGVIDVFVRDRQQGTTIRITGGSSIFQSFAATSPSISSDGHYIVFNSETVGDSSAMFLYDMKTQQTVFLRDGYNPHISGDGDSITFEYPDQNIHSQVFEYNRLSRQTTLVSAAVDGNGGNDDSGGFSPGGGSCIDDRGAFATSADGQSIAFDSYASNLVVDDTNDRSDIFLRDLSKSQTIQVSAIDPPSVYLGYPHCAAISADGRIVAFVARDSAVYLYPGSGSSQPPDCAAIGGFKVAEGICGKDQGGIKLAVADLTNPDVKVALATEIVSQTAGLFRQHTVEHLVSYDSPVGDNGVAQHYYVAVNGTIFGHDCYISLPLCKTTGTASILGIGGWIYGTKGGGYGDASKLDTTNPSFFSYAANRIAAIHRRRDASSGNIGDFDVGDATYITNTIVGAEFAVGVGRTILDGVYVAGNDALGSKTAVGVSQDGKRVFIAVGDRNSSFTSSEALAAALKAAGAYRAVLLDGGGSPQITSVTASGSDLEYSVYGLYARRVINGIVLYNAASTTSTYAAITTAGGTFTFGPGIIATFAPNTFTNAVTLAYAPVASPEGDLYVSLDRSFELTAQATTTAAQSNGANLVVNRPYTLTVSYDQQLIPTTMSAASFGIYTLTESGWQREPTSTVDQSAHTITAQINHIGDFAVLALRPQFVYLPLTTK